MKPDKVCWCTFTTLLHNILLKSMLHPTDCENKKSVFVDSKESMTSCDLHFMNFNAFTVMTPRLDYSMWSFSSQDVGGGSSRLTASSRSILVAFSCCALKQNLNTSSIRGYLYVMQAAKPQRWNGYLGSWNQLTTVYPKSRYLVLWMWSSRLENYVYF